MPPSPVLCRQPDRSQPRFNASTAGALSDPKLIADTLTTESIRKAPRRRRAAPSTLGARNPVERIEAGVLGQRGR